MLPHAPLRLGLTEIKGVSVPAREVGGDFFNYFHARERPDRAARRRRLRQGRRRRAADGEHPGVAAHAPRARTGSVGPRRARSIATSKRTRRGRSTRRCSSAFSNPATRRLRYVNAGHHPQFVLRRSGGLERMSSTGLPVGLLRRPRSQRGHRAARCRRRAVLLHRRLRRGRERKRRHVRHPSGSKRCSRRSTATAPTKSSRRVESGVNAFRGSRSRSTTRR